MTDPDQPLLDLAAAGDPSALGLLLTRHRPRLRLLLDCRMDPKLRSRVDASDILQETYLEASQRFANYLADANGMTFFLWLRFLATQRLAQIHRTHVKVQARSVLKERPLPLALPPNADKLAAHLAASRTTPGHAAMRAELRGKLRAALEALDDHDREILALRHYEQLSNAEAAAVLGLRESAASHRYARALLRLKDQLSDPASALWGEQP